MAKRKQAIKQPASADGQAGKKPASRKTATTKKNSQKKKAPEKVRTSAVQRKTKASNSVSRKKTVKRTIAQAPKTPVTVGYSGKPLIKKLGIKPGTTLTLLGEPQDFLKMLGGLPDNLKIKKTALGDRDLTIWFPRNAAELKRRIKSIAGDIHDGGLWIAWPKKSAAVKTDLTQDMVRELGLKQGIVDYKICAIDETYSGLKFANRKK